MNKIVILGLLLVSFSPAAEEPLQPVPTNQYDYSAWNFGVGYLSLDSEQAYSQGIGDDATYFQFGWTGQSVGITYGFGLSGLLLDDQDSFAVTVDSPYYGTSVESSDATAWGGYGELGYSYNFGNTGKIDLMAGVEFLGASRGITNCVDCPEEDIDLDSGFYIQPRLRFIQQNGFIFSLAYRQYLNNDLESGLILDFAWQAY